MADVSIAPPTSLRRDALFQAALHWAGLGAVLAAAVLYIPLGSLFWGGVFGAAVLGYLHGVLFSHLHVNRKEAATLPMPRLGAANTITLSRGFLVSVLAALAGACLAGEVPCGTGAAWVAAIFYGIVVTADLLDGVWARRTGTATVLGKMLDIRMDALGLLVAPFLGVVLGRLPGFYLLVGACYYGFQWGLGLRRKRGKPIFPETPRPHARLTAGIHMLFVALALTPILDARAIRWAAVPLMVPLVGGFFWDWAVVTGAICDQNRPHLYQSVQKTGTAIALVSRFVLLSFGLQAGRNLLFCGSQTVFFIWIVLLIPLVIGFAGRSAAVAAAILLAAHPCGWAHGAASQLSFMAAVCLLLTGTGPGSLWRPEDRIWMRGAG